MIILYTAIPGLVIWIVLWSLGVKSLDAFLIPFAMIVLSVGVRALLPYLPGNRRDEPGGGRSWTPR